MQRVTIAPEIFSKASGLDPRRLKDIKLDYLSEG